MVVACISDVFVNLGEILAESSIGIDNGELGGLPAELASADMEVPDGLRNKEIVILDLPVEVVGRNVEESLPSVEVEMHSVALGNSGLPRGVVGIGVEGVHSVTPGILKSLDFSKILFLAHSDDQVLVLDHTTISQNNLVILRIEPFDSDIVRSGVVLAEGLSSGRSKIELGDSG